MNNKLNCAAALVTAALAATSARAENILGIDVSSSQGSINWTSVKSDGVDFAYVRATQGTNFEDTYFSTNMTKGKAAGIQMGAYEISEPYADTPAEEANYFWNYAGGYIKADGKSISPAITFTAFEGHEGAPTYTAWFNAWSADVQAKTSASMHPAIYVSACAGACDLTTNITLAGWVANYNGENLYTGNPWLECVSCNPWDPGGSGGWTYWQVSDTGAISGISGDVDLDAYDGTLASLKATEGVGGE